MNEHNRNQIVLQQKIDTIEQQLNKSKPPTFAEIAKSQASAANDSEILNTKDDQPTVDLAKGKRMIQDIKKRNYEKWKQEHPEVVQSRQTKRIRKVVQTTITGIPRPQSYKELKEILDTAVRRQWVKHYCFIGRNAIEALVDADSVNLFKSQVEQLGAKVLISKAPPELLATKSLTVATTKLYLDRELKRLDFFAAERPSAHSDRNAFYQQLRENFVTRSALLLDELANVTSGNIKEVAMNVFDGCQLNEANTTTTSSLDEMEEALMKSVEQEFDTPAATDVC